MGEYDQQSIGVQETAWQTCRSQSLKLEFGTGRAGMMNDLTHIDSFDLYLELKGRGYAVILFSPAEPTGLNPKAVEEALTEQGRYAIDILNMNGANGF
jgi:hypothetical protein